MRRAGADVISFAAGEPDFGTPSVIAEAGIQAIKEGFTRYTPSSGIPELKQAIAEKLCSENGIEADPANIVVSAGAKQAVFNALMALCNAGDEVILLAPFWMTYADQILLAGGKPVIVHCSSESGYLPDPGDVRAAITDKTKALIINSPCNPTGAVFPRELLRAIVDAAVLKGIWIISDEIYEKHIYPPAEHVSPASLGTHIAERTVTVGGVSKTYAMTGWRIGYASAPAEIARAMATIQDQVTSNASSISQKAAVVALRSAGADVEEMVKEFDFRRSLMMQELSKISQLDCGKPQGAFYVFVDARQAIAGRIKDDFELAAYLLEEQCVACVPGSVFHGPGRLRLTYALSREQITEGIRRIAEGIKSLT